MAAKIVDVILRMKDQMSDPMSKAAKNLQNHARQYQKIGRQMIRTGKSIQKAGSTLTKTITAPLVGLGALSYKEYGEYDKSLRLVQTTMGSTAEESEMLSNTIKQAAKDSVYGMQDAADAALNFARAGFNAQQAADMIAPSFQLAAGTGTELGDVTAGIASAMKVFGANSKDATKYADIFARAQAQAKIETKDLFDAVSRAGEAFDTAKWNVSDLSVAVGVLGDAGVNGAVAGNALKSGIASITKAKKTLEALGASVVNQDGSYKSFVETQKELHDVFVKLSDAEQVELATSIFGKNQMVKWLTIIKQSPEHIREMEAALAGASGTSKEMADSLMSGPGGAIEKLKSNWDIFKKTVGETIAPVITPLLEKLTSLMQTFSNLSEEQKKNIIKWAGIAAAVGPALLIFGKGLTVIGTLIKGLGKFGSLLKGTGVIAKVFSAGGGAAVLGVFGAIAAAIVLVIKNWDAISKKISDFYQKVKPALDKIGAAFKKVGELISSIASSYIMNVFNQITDVLGGFLDALGGVIDFITGIFSGDWAKAWEGIKEVFKGVWDALVGIVKGAVNGIIGAINLLIDGVNTVFNALRKPSNFVKDYVNADPELAKAAKKQGIDIDNLNSSIPHIPTLARGTSSWRGGVVQISEKGGEIVDLPSGSRVYPHDESVRKAYADGQSINITIPKFADQIVVREDADIDKIASKIAHKLEKTSQNIGASRIGYQF